MGARVMVMAGGTGGHVFPALAVARELRQRGADVVWLGSRGGFEVRVVPDAGFRSEWISIRGLRGKGAGQWLFAPFRILLAMWQAFRILRRNSPALVLGMGGFASGPGGVMARLLRIPLVIHEQNAIPGLTNRWLARIASRVLEAFPGSFKAAAAIAVGNPVRPEIVALPTPRERMGARGEKPRLLLLGGSQGARALNEIVPLALAEMDPAQRPQIRHQAGKEKVDVTAAAYEKAGVEATVTPFIADMAEAYGWADLVVCRAGALTISELAAAGVGSVLVPYPFAVDDHQTRNAAFLTESGAARLLPETELSPQRLALLLEELLPDRTKLLEMATAARECAQGGAAARVADVCEEAMGI
jgi:UDP-N-acetylglucosamine--N-acetylmuramyl-(pentapeptide) pyrophosphoryl-undecaprenol N-acetylglucosamine transferase